MLGEGADWVEHAGSQQFHVSTIRTNICQENVRVLVVAKLVDLIHVWRNLGDELDYRVCLVVELNVLDAAFCSSNDALIILFIHLNHSDRILSLDANYHVRVVRRHDLCVLVGVSDHAATCA